MVLSVHDSYLAKPQSSFGFWLFSGVRCHTTVIQMSNRTALSISLVAVVPLTIAFYLTSSIILFYALFPGAVVSLLITGGHGGTRTEELVAPIVGAAVNVVLLSLLLRGAARIVRTKT
jgi:hypothetical protein